MSNRNLILAAAGGAPSGPTDPNFKETVLLLHGDGTNGAQNNTFLDSSTNNFTITRNGNTTQGTFSPFSADEGKWSNYFDGTSDYLQAASNADFQFGTGEFVIEGWYYFTGASANYTPLFSNGTFSSGVMVRFGTNSDLYINGTQRTWTGTTGTFPFNSWNHVCLVRTSTTVSLFINGTRVLTATDSANISPTSAFTICDQTHSLGSGFTGYVNNFRTIKGDDGPYDATQTTITVPTAPFIANTTNQVLLTCYSNRFVDANTATTAKTVTVTGNTSVQPFSPFAPSAAYSASVNGGSGYFDGTGDYLDVGSSNSAVSFGTGDFTIQCWINPRTIVDQDGLITGSSVGWVLYFYPNSQLQWGRISPKTPANLGGTSSSVSTNTWTHVEVTRSSGTVRIFLNGALEATITDTADYSANGNLRIGRSHAGNDFDGYIAGLQVIKGTALHTSAFTPPTSPPTAVSGTSILCNFTNAGIFDNTGKNNLETVGNAQIDTTTVKYGTGSMEFDGTGDWLLLANNVNQQLGTGNFTIEFWVYLASGDTGSNRGLVAKGTSTTGFLVSLNTTEKVVFTYATSTITSSGAITTNAWNHIAVVREGTGSNQTKIYIGGTNDGTGTVSTDFNQTSVMYVGANRTGGDPMKGFIDDLRITKGIARYTANFTPPGGPFPDQ